MVGDLNITMWSPDYQRLARQTDLHNVRQGFGILPTWPIPETYGKIPPILSWLLSIPIAHCLISSEIKAVSISTGPNIGSDHRPLIVDLLLTREGARDK